MEKCNSEKDKVVQWKAKRTTHNLVVSLEKQLNVIESLRFYVLLFVIYYYYPLNTHVLIFKFLI